ncbi:hypothetical protein GCM10020229_06570 [Kitasatospora albolonga]
MPGFPTDAPPHSEAPEGWVDHFLLAGPGQEVCLRFERPVTRSALRSLVDARRASLAAAGLTDGGTVALRLPPSLGYVAALLAAWQLGAQVALLDHRLTDHETAAALERLAPQVLVEADRPPPAGLRGFSEVEPVVTTRPDGLPARSPHALVQLSSGSTGPSKVIARTAGDLLRELAVYRALPGFPAAGGRTVLLSSVVHVLGLVGGLLHALHARVQLTVPERMTAAGILAAVAEEDLPTTVIGVPFHAELLAGVRAPRPLPHLTAIVVAGELTRPGVAGAVRDRYGVPLGTMYGMTELGVIATDLDGTLAPAVRPVPGLELRTEGGELHIRRPDSPYLGLTDPSRWSDGWLHTRDAAAYDTTSGLLTVHGRRDSQVSIGGLKVDLTEVEHTLAALPEVREAVVVFEHGAVEAYLVPSEGAGAEQIRAGLEQRLAGYKRPRRLALLPALPRTATGKLLRDPAGLRAAAAAL